MRPLIFFSRVKPTIAAGFCGLDALAVNNRDAGLFGAAHPLSGALAQQIVDPYQRTVLVPLLEVVEYGTFGRKTFRQ